MAATITFFPRKIRCVTGSFIMLMVLLASSHTTPVLALQPNFEPPVGFILIKSAPGIDLYQKNYPGGSPDFVQVINLSAGASLHPTHGPVSEYRSGAGVYGGDDPRLQSMSLPAYWDNIVGEFPDVFCLSNGQFFYMLEYPTRLPFPLKIDHQIFSDGYGISDFVDQKLMLELWADRADISFLTKEAFYNSNAPDIIAGLSEDANKRAKQHTGRTFVGVDDRNQDGEFEIVLFFNTHSARQSDAASVLRDFGADKVMMLDGGGSTQLFCQGEWLVYSDRLIPQAIAVIAANDRQAISISKIPEDLPEFPHSAEVNHPSTPPPAVISVTLFTTDTSVGAQPPLTPTTDQLGEANAIVPFATPDTNPISPPSALQLSSLLWIPLIIVPSSFVIFLLALHLR